MKGLLKNNFYGIVENVKIALVFIFVFGMLLVITGNAAMLSIFSLISTPVIAVLIISCLRKESASKWEKYKLTLPVQRKDIVKSQYMNHILLSIMGTILVAVFLFVTVMIHGNQYFYYGFRDAITLVLGGTILSVLIGVIAYPLYYLWGVEKTEAIAVLSVIGAVAVVFCLSMFVNIITGNNGVSDFIYYISLVWILIITIILFGTSYILSNLVFKKREY